MQRISWIGVGIMGKAMVRNLMKAGYEVHIYARHPEKVADVVSEGAVPHGSIAECVKASEMVITMVGFPKDVEEVYFAPGNILDSAAKGMTLIDMTTTSPTLAQRIYREGTARGLRVLDAPVTGGDSGARAGTLSILVGGDQAGFDACLPIFQAMGTTILYEGKAGTGQHTKMANQIALTGCIAGVCEAITYARKTGLDIQTMLDSISAGAAGSWQMSNMAPRMLKGDFNPGFFIKHYIKDMNIATEEGREAGADLSISEAVLSIYKDLEAKGLGDLGTQALLKHYLDV